MTVHGECQLNNGAIKNCCHLGYNNNVKRSGVYTIAHFCGMKYSNTQVYCNTSSGVDRRKDGSVEFQQRDWVEYEDGFGNLNGEFWIGLRSIIGDVVMSNVVRRDRYIEVKIWYHFDQYCQTLVV